MTSEVVINNCYGGFGLSNPVIKRLAEFGHKKSIDCINRDVDYSGYLDIERHDPILIKVVKELGLAASSTNYSNLVICEIKSNKYKIMEYDGIESLMLPETIDWTVIAPTT